MAARLESYVERYAFTLAVTDGLRCADDAELFIRIVDIPARGGEISRCALHAGSLRYAVNGCMRLERASCPETAIKCEVLRALAVICWECSSSLLILHGRGNTATEDDAAKSDQNNFIHLFHYSGSCVLLMTRGGIQFLGHHEQPSHKMLVETRKNGKPQNT